ncbi:hybrid sensor histidine kinase/response regulator [Teichococcus coralli]|nr:hybrid sensor histidine kinase/response regulator [Pseudoroseomonas coralli]
MNEAGRDHATQAGHARQNSASKRLEDENEQLRLSLGSVREEAEAFAEERAELERKLDVRTRALRQAEAQLAMHRSKPQDFRGRLGTPGARLLDVMASRRDRDAPDEEGRIALEEMRVLAEELEAGNAALSLANQELEQRVSSRTSELAAAREALHRSEERLRLALTFAGAGEWDLRLGENRATWSKEWCALHGLDAASAEPCRETWTGRVHPEDLLAVEAALERSLKGGQPDFAVEYRLRDARGGERWLAGRGRLLHDAHGHPMQLSGLSFDITARKAAERVLARRNLLLEEEVEAAMAARQAAQTQRFQTMKMEALGQLTGGVAHDFNNVLAVLISGMTLLLRADSEEQRNSLLQSMMQAARRGATLTQRLLTFARRQPLQSDPLELQIWMQEMHGLAAPVLRAGMRLKTEAEGDVGPVLVDRGELEQAMLNVLVNARDAMPNGGTVTLSARKVHVQAASDPDGLDGDFVELGVEDEGHGIPPEMLPRIFEPFFTTKPVGKGTGLGLPQVYGFARQSGGTVRVASEVGKGTRIALLLPCAKGAGQCVTVPQGEAPAPMAQDAPMLVLVVEDDDQVAAMTVELLRTLGHTVQRVSSTDEALHALEQTQFDFLLADVMLGGGPDGIELAVAVSRLWPNLPLLLASGYGGMPERIAAAKLPLLRKPFGEDELRQAIRAVCARAGRALSPCPGPAARPTGRSGPSADGAARLPSQGPS